jgi:hypothetical protein
MSAAEQSDRRKHRRLPLAFPLRFSTRSGGGASLHGQGMTLDISSGGVCFETDLVQLPPARSEISVYIAVPRQSDTPESALFISVRATIVRTIALDATSRHLTGARWAVAARFEMHPDISLPIPEGFGTA